MSGSHCSTASIQADIRRPPPRRAVAPGGRPALGARRSADGDRSSGSRPRPGRWRLVSPRPATAGSPSRRARISARRSRALRRPGQPRWSTPTASSAASPCLAGRMEPMQRNTRSTNAPPSICSSRGRALSGSSRARNAPVYVPSAPRHRIACSSCAFSFSFSREEAVVSAPARTGGHTARFRAPD